MAKGEFTKTGVSCPLTVQCTAQHHTRLRGMRGYIWWFPLLTVKCRIEYLTSGQGYIRIIHIIALFAVKNKQWKTRSLPINGAWKTPRHKKIRHFGRFFELRQMSTRSSWWYHIRFGCRLGRRGCPCTVRWSYVRQWPNYLTLCRPHLFYAILCSI